MHRFPHCFRRMTNILIFTCLTFAGASCSRSSGEVWEDSKTATHYWGEGVRALFGGHGESRQVSHRGEFYHHQDSTQHEFVPLQDEDIYTRLTMGDMSVLEERNAPLSREAPGEQGSPIPGIDGFIAADDVDALKQVFKRIHFPYNSDLIKGRDNVETVEKITKFLNDNPDVYVFIEGHCDERGSAAYNLALGARRGNSVRNHLIKEGVSLDRLFTISYGKERPLASGNEESFWSRNRRAQFRIYQRS